MLAKRSEISFVILVRPLIEFGMQVLFINYIRAADISGNLLDWFTNYLFKRGQRVVLPGVESLWTFIKAGVPQGSILGPLLSYSLLMISWMRYIQIFGFSLMIQVYILSWNIPDVTVQLLNIDLETIAKWAKLWLVTFNPSKNGHRHVDSVIAFKNVQSWQTYSS